MDNLKTAFDKVKIDIQNLNREIDFLKVSLNEINWKLECLNKKVEEKKVKTEFSVKPFSYNLNSDYFKDLEQIKGFSYTTHPSTHRQEVPIETKGSSTHNYSFKPLKDQNMLISTGNEGVPTDKQTNQQTDNSTHFSFNFNDTGKVEKKPNNADPIKDAADILDSLDSLKKEIRLKFKRLTDQELSVFTKLYELDEELGYTGYKTLASALNLSESSIRDYVGRLIGKGIPVDKLKVNNKSIQLRVSESLKKVATLPTILKLMNI
jgi:hypothetical protein